MSGSLLPLLFFCVSMTATPGPNNIMLTASGANFGFKRSIPHMAGIVAGMQTVIAVCALGLGQVFIRYAGAHTALEVCGSAYLLYLAWKIATIPPSTVKNADEEFDVDGAGTKAAVSKPMTFLQAALFQWINPKCWLMVVGSLATFAKPETMVEDATLIAIVFLLVGPPSISMWTLVGTKIRMYLKTPQRHRAFNMTMAALLVSSLGIAHADALLQVIA